MHTHAPEPEHAQITLALLTNAAVLHTTHILSQLQYPQNVNSSFLPLSCCECEAGQDM